MAKVTLFYFLHSKSNQIYVRMMNFITTLSALLLIFTTENVQGSEVCYHPYGCYSDAYPFNEALVQLPQNPIDVGTIFTLYTRNNPTTGEFLNPTASRSPSRANFNPNKTTVVFVHGYVENKGRWYVPVMIKELLKFEDMNVIFCEWAKGARFPYHQAVGNTRLVGDQMSRMIEVIRNDTGINWKKLRLVGFSIGAHVAAYAAQNLKKKGLFVPRLTGLDPAAPYFETKHIDRRIDPTDAKFVDVIHTDSKTLFINGFGTIKRVGHVDFFPNGGYHQIGCGKLDIGIMEYFACSHYRSMRYFLESINHNNCPFYGYPCKSYEKFTKGECNRCPDEGCPQMGYHVTKPSRLLPLKFFLKTSNAVPYCAFHYQFIFHTNYGVFADLNDYVTVTLTGTNGTDIIELPHHYYGSGSKEKIVGLGTKYIGEPTNIHIGHSGILDAWYLRSVTVRRMHEYDDYSACYNKWLNGANEFTLKKNDCNCECIGYKDTVA